ncbi:MAG: DUF924 domain-containing protein [Alphaproteobacteria bacterium HGW-Alphaproteobacteria-6]|nr:MAG: DUF924 domain-containing protein [Alphaproteobacteria bacterium HGW-Alphaproteobacteria-6]
MADTAKVLEFWLNEVGPRGWYVADPAVDDEIRSRFLTLWQEAEAGDHGHWTSGPRGALAYLILTDQFPRNMFRDEARAFATDGRARAAADAAIAAGHDTAIAEPERQFFYLPFMHSEDIADQDRCIALIAAGLPASGAGNRRHAEAHREVIARFGRFPYRNAALGRATTAAEAGFLAAGGYGAILRELDQSHA